MIHLGAYSTNIKIICDSLQKKVQQPEELVLQHAQIMLTCVNTITTFRSSGTTWIKILPSVEIALQLAEIMLQPI